VKKIQKHIEIVCSGIPGMSSISSQSRRDLFNLLSAHYSTVGISLINTIEDLENIVKMRPDLVFVGMKYVSPDPKLKHNDPTKVWITQFLDSHNIQYTGSGHSAHKLESQKHLAKGEVLKAGFNTSAYCVSESTEPNIKEITLNYPVFIKPTNMGGGAGIDSFSFANDFKSLKTKIQSLRAKYGVSSLVEEYLPGREFSVAILKNEMNNDYMLMPLELIAPPDINNRRILSAQIKKDYGNFPKACKINMDMSYESMILSIVRLGLRRSETADEDDLEPSLGVHFSPVVAI